MRDVEYNRDAAVSYAHTWAYKRNPRYADFAGMGATAQILCPRHYMQARA